VDKSLTPLFSYTVLLGAPLVFGVLGKPAEAGVCVIAGAIGLAFINIDKIKRFKGGGFEAEMKEQLEAMVAKEAEPDDEPVTSGFQGQGFGFDENTRKIILALNNSRYTWRSVSGVAQESGLPCLSVTRSLKWLEENGLVMRVGVRKRINWGLTEQGRDVANSLPSKA
jgi:hypothetical protein